MRPGPIPVKSELLLYTHVIAGHHTTVHGKNLASFLVLLNIIWLKKIECYFGKSKLEANLHKAVYGEKLMVTFRTYLICV